MQYASRKDIQDLLEILNTTNDSEIRSKIFSLFAYYLVSDNSSNRDLIITNHFVYDKIYTMLSIGLPKKITVTLNFVTALLFDAEDDSCSTKQSLVLHAQHMMRMSGCLALMSNLFNSCMVHQETWTALCRCLSEVCRHSEENQSYCSDLIYTAIRRCSSGDAECYQVLQSLLHKHDRNTQQFIEYNGLAIFTRDKLHNTSCLKLVNAISQNPKAVVSLVHNTDIVSILRNFLDLYEKESQIVQWATIVLYHIKTLIKDIDKYDRKEPKTYSNNNKSCGDTIQYITSVNKDPNKDQPRGETNFRFCINDDNTTNKLTTHCDTTELFQNIFREMLQGPKDGVNVAPRQNTYKYQDTNNIESKKYLNVHSLPSRKHNSSRNLYIRRPDMTQKKNNLHAPGHSRSDLSFSFLLNDNLKLNRNSGNSQQFGVASFNISKRTSFGLNTSIDIEVERNLEESNKMTRGHYNVTEIIENMEESSDPTLEFKPTIVSTPKRSLSAKRKQLSNYTIKNLKTEKTKRNDTFKNQKTPIKEIKNKSFSGKLFGAINESCTMLVKTVKNIFTSRNTDDTTRAKEQISVVNTFKRKAHSNYSFMDYMRRRDAIMGSQCRDLSSEKKSSGSCATCNDTVLLKLKLEKDYQLRQTLKKLKFGINLYGCDFKKISATMWPRDSYMTPTVLYNLYRKLIAK